MAVFVGRRNRKYLGDPSTHPAGWCTFWPTFWLLAVNRELLAMVKLAAVCVASLVASVSVQVKLGEVTAVTTTELNKLKHVRRNYTQSAG